MTGSCSYDYAVKCADLNIQGYIQKPFNKNEMLKKIKTVLEIEDYHVLKERWGDEYEERLGRISPTVKKILRHIHDNEESVVTREETAFVFNISPDHLGRLFRQDCDMTFKEYVHLHKTNRGKEYLLNEKGMTIQHVAKSVGISDANYFCRLFRKYNGLSPNEYRKR